jgi:hypothetical protein
MELNTENFDIIALGEDASTLLLKENEVIPDEVEHLITFFLKNKLNGFYLYRTEPTEGCKQAIEERNKSLKDFLKANGLPNLTEGNEVKTLVSINEVHHIPATHKLKQKSQKRDGLKMGTLNPFNLLNDFWNTHIAFDDLIENSEVTLKDGTKTHILVTNAGDATWGILIEGKENIKNAFDTLRLFGAKFNTNISSPAQRER